MSRVISFINLKGGEAKNTVRGKYGDEFKDFKNLVEEIMKRCDEYEE